MNTPRMGRFRLMPPPLSRALLSGHRWLAPVTAVVILTVAATSVALANVDHDPPPSMAANTTLAGGVRDAHASPACGLAATPRRAGRTTAPGRGTVGSPHQSSPATAGSAGSVTASGRPPRARPSGTGAASQGTARDTRPVLAVVGASFSAGYGASGPDQAWPAVAARTLGWKLRVAADPGSGYLKTGNWHLGPMSALIDSLDLVRLHPSVVLIQSGHNDIGQPPGKLAVAVRSLIGKIRCQAPQARVGVITVVISGDKPTYAALATDRTIVAAARQADPNVTVFDPLAEQWHYPRISDQLHPNPAGHRWIAARIAPRLRGMLTSARPHPAPTRSGGRQVAVTGHAGAPSARRSG